MHSRCGEGATRAGTCLRERVRIALHSYPGPQAVPRVVQCLWVTVNTLQESTMTPRSLTVLALGALFVSATAFAVSPTLSGPFAPFNGQITHHNLGNSLVPPGTQIYG